MKPADVAKSYDSIAERWRSDQFPEGHGRKLHERALSFVETPRIHGQGGMALDIGSGGSGRILELMLDNGFTAEGLDLSERMLELARERHSDLTFHHADVCDWEFPRRYHFISAWDSIWHVPLDLQESVLRKILNGLSPGGVCIFTMGGTEEPGEVRDSAMGPPMYHATLGVPRVLEILADSASVLRHLEYDQPPEPHVCVIAQRLG